MWYKAQQTPDAVLAAPGLSSRVYAFPISFQALPANRKEVFP